MEGQSPFIPPLKVVLPWLSGFVPPYLPEIDFCADLSVSVDKSGKVVYTNLWKTMEVPYTDGLHGKDLSL
jgi:hypothetical protein